MTAVIERAEAHLVDDDVQLSRAAKIKDYQKKYRADNAEKAKAYGVKWRVDNAVKVKNYLIANAEKIKSGKDAYHRENAAEERASAKIYRAKNALKMKASTERWRANNPEKVKAATAAWHAANPDAEKISAHNRRARKRESSGRLSIGLAAKLFKLQRGKCPCYKQPLGNDFHMDHVMPLSRGGSNTSENMQLLRSLCNLQKHAAHPVAFMQSRGFLL